MLIDILAQIPDPRRSQGKRYQLHFILFFSILAILSNASSYREIHSFIETHYTYLTRKYKLHWKTAPSYTGIRSIILSITTQHLENAFRSHALSLVGDQDALAVDGKTIRGSYDTFTNSGALHVLFGYLVDAGIVLGHESVSTEKTNEIPKLIELLATLNYSPSVVSADAMHCQVKSSRYITQGGGMGVLQVKGNQEKLHTACQVICNTYNPTDKYVSRTLKHARYEKRHTYIFNRADYLQRHIPMNWSKEVESVVCVVRERTAHKGRSYGISRDTSYYVMSRGCSAKASGELIRSHWGIENRLNYVRDESMKEDESRIRVCPMHMVILKSCALNLLRAGKVQNIKNQLFKNAMNVELAISFTNPIMEN